MTRDTSAAPHGALAAKIHRTLSGTLKRVLPIGLLLISLAVLAGCDLIRDSYLADPPYVQNDREKEDGPPPAINLDEYEFPFDVKFCSAPNCPPDEKITISPGEGTKPKAEGDAELEAGEEAKHTAYEIAVTAAAVAAGIEDDSTKEKARFLRNQLFHAISARSYELCQFHKAGIIGYAASANFATGFLETSLSAISAAVGGETAKTILSTTSAVIGAGRAEFNAEIFQNLLTTAILEKIEEDRSVKLVAIQEKSDESTDEYAVDEMLVGLNEYHYACSFMNGLVQLASGTKRKVATRAEIDTEIDDLKGRNIKIAEEIGGIYSELEKLDPAKQQDRKRALEKQVQSLELAFQQNSARLTQLRAMRFSAGVKSVSEDVENTDQ
ncbi:MAG: hypothetical protein QF449_07760 [Alphaproteobacteria bacterium]|jgi:hypothetical protein|nr:hypothetical protein [Alphaproteobacteria bacterium]|tara:strand:+ start:190 stop:1338 length:1149 start_codon:yes stop_codon:yes gene_type:complete